MQQLPVADCVWERGRKENPDQFREGWARRLAGRRDSSSELCGSRTKVCWNQRGVWK